MDNRQKLANVVCSLHWTEMKHLRARLQAGGWDLLAEYAHKTRDPHADNHYDGSAGRVVMLSAAWSGGPVEALVRARRTENMAFRSRRDATGLSSMLNH